MKAIKLTAIWGGWLLHCLLFLHIRPIGYSALLRSENYCFTCHTNPRKLIEITRELS
jgi:hypothetical protein